METEIRLYSKNFVLLKVWKDPGSIIWTNRYQALGDSEIFLTFAELGNVKIEPGYFLERHDAGSSDYFGDFHIIRHIETTRGTKKDGILIQAKDVLDMFNQRVLHFWWGTNNATVKELIRTMIRYEAFHQDTVGDPMSTTGEYAWAAGRTLSNIWTFNDSGWPTTTVSGQWTQGALMDTLYDIAKKADIHIRSRIQHDTGKLFFGCLEYTSPTITLRYNDGDIDSYTYIQDQKNYGTYVQAVGEGDSSISWTRYPRAYKGYGTSAAIAGANRYEKFHDHTTISHHKDDGTDYTAAQYSQILNNVATEDLSSHPLSRYADVVIRQGTITKADIGKIVRIQLPEIVFTARIVEIVESWDSTGYKLTPTLQVLTEIT